jgi:hypothetical protein
MSNVCLLAERRNFMTAIKGIVALLLVAAPALAAAETIFKYRRPDGRIVYSDSTVKGAKRIGVLDLPVPPPSVPRSEPRFSSEVAVTRRADLAAADAEIREATLALRNAEERQTQGVEPLPGERLGMVGGNSRLSESYFERQQVLANEVDMARARLDEATRLRNAARGD